MERKKFHESAELFRQFEQVDEFVYSIGKVKNEFNIIYTEIGREMGTPSVIGHVEYSSDETRNEIKNALERYNQIVSQIEDPVWRDRVSGELGYYLHLIYTEHCLEKDKALFENFDLQRYFK